MIDYKKIYELLDNVNPIDTDCGISCGAACCQLSEDGDLGMYLLPDERIMHDINDDWLTWSSEDAYESGFPESWKGKVDFVVCKGPKECKRALRPVQCRTFPLAPHLTEEGDLYMIINDMDLPYTCPLMDDFTSINEEFIQVTKKAWSMLLEDKRIYDLVYEDSRIRDEGDSDFILAI